LARDIFGPSPGAQSSHQVSRSLPGALGGCSCAMACTGVGGRGHLRGRRCSLLALAALAATVGTAVHLLLPESSGPRPGAAFIGKSRNASESVEYAKQTLLEADAVFFDVDSTVVRTEGINLLGRCFGVMKQIEELTHQAMNGNVKFQTAMAQRLELMADNGMTRDSLERCVKTEGRPRWSPGIQNVVRQFHVLGKDVYLVSGGFFNMIEPVAEALDIPTDRVYANTILFDDEGNYKGFDRKAPTSRSGGKPAVLRQVRRKEGYKTMVMIGDGATDLDARTKGPAKAFIGYGGVTAREKVKDGSDWFIYSFKEILAILPKVEA